MTLSRIRTVCSYGCNLVVNTSVLFSLDVAIGLKVGVMPSNRSKVCVVFVHVCVYVCACVRMCM